MGKENVEPTHPDMVTVEDIAASFQAAVVDVLVYKSLRAAKATGAGAITLTGGVAANSQLRASLKVCRCGDGCRSLLSTDEPVYG